MKKGQITTLALTALFALLLKGDGKVEDFGRLVNAVNSKYEESIQSSAFLRSLCSKDRKKTTGSGNPEKVIDEYKQRKDIFVISVPSYTDHSANSYIIGVPVAGYEQFPDTVVFEQIGQTFDQYCGWGYGKIKGYHIDGKNYIPRTTIREEARNIFEQGKTLKAKNSGLTLEEKFILRTTEEYKSEKDLENAWLLSMIWHEKGHKAFPNPKNTDESVQSEISALLSQLRNAPTYQTLKWMHWSTQNGDEITKPSCNYVLGKLVEQLRKEKPDFKIDDLADVSLEEIRKEAKSINYH